MRFSFDGMHLSQMTDTELTALSNSAAKLNSTNQLQKLINKELAKREV